MTYLSVAPDVILFYFSSFEHFSINEKPH